MKSFQRASSKNDVFPTRWRVFVALLENGVKIVNEFAELNW